MKPALNHPRARNGGFTLVEIYIVAAIFVMLVLAMVASQFLAARVYTLAATKLTANGVRTQGHE